MPQGWELTNVCTKCQLFLYIWDSSIVIIIMQKEIGETQQMTTTNKNGSYRFVSSADTLLG